MDLDSDGGEGVAVKREYVHTDPMARLIVDELRATPQYNQWTTKETDICTNIQQMKTKPSLQPDIEAQHILSTPANSPRRLEAVFLVPVALPLP